MKLKIISIDNKDAGELTVADEVFGAAVRPDILQRTVRWQLAKRRAGTQSTKTIGEVSGTTRKPWKQKGTGRARAGTYRAPQFRGGGVVFAPKPRDHGHKLQKKVRRLALKSAISSKQADGKLIILESAALKDAKTSALCKQIEKLGWPPSILVIDGAQVDGNFARAAHNIPGIDVLPQQGANVYDILRRDILVLTKDAVQLLEARLK